MTCKNGFAASRKQMLVLVLVLTGVGCLLLPIFQIFDSTAFPTNGHSKIKHKVKTITGGTSEGLNLLVDNVVLAGKFNFATDIKYVHHWVTRWRTMFRHVVVHGPFNETDVVALDQLGIQAFSGADDAGYYSQMTSMVTTLRHFANNTSIIGVVLSHDDFVFNLSHLQSLGFPSNDIIFPTIKGNLEEPLYEFTKNYTMRRWKGTAFIPTDNYSKILPYSWLQWSKCIPQLANAVAKDPRADKFVMDNESFFMFPNAQADFTYMPMIYAEKFSEMADWLVDNEVYLEIGVPMILGFLHHKYNATIKFGDKCEGSYNRNRNDYFSWTPECFIRGSYMGFHPMKLGLKGIEAWDTYFNFVNTPKCGKKKPLQL